MVKSSGSSRRKLSEKRFKTSLLGWRRGLRRGMVESRLFVGLRRPSNSQKRFSVRICFGCGRWQSMHLGTKCTLETQRSRVLWRFIAGMNNDFIRQEVLRQKWLTAEGKPKEYEEVLNAAEEARPIQMGMRAAGPVTGIGVSDSSVPTTVIGVSVVQFMQLKGCQVRESHFKGCRDR